MDSNATQFSRLPARRVGLIRRASVWDAGEYLLSITGTTFSETYRRYYYRDIKAIVLQEGPRLGSIGALLATLWFALTLSVVAFTPKAPAVLRWMPLLPWAWLAWLIYVNIARSCRVYIFTAVSSEELPAIFRQRCAARTLPTILGKIKEAQGSVSGEQSDLNMAAAVASSVNPREQQQSLPATRQILYSVLAFSFLFIGSAIFAYWYRSVIWLPAPVLTAKTLLILLNTMEVATGIWALFKLHRVRLMTPLRFCVFAGLAVLGLRLYSLLTVMSLLDQQNNPISKLLSTAHLRYWVGTVDSACSLLIALGALISLMLNWQEAESRELVSSL